MTSTVPHQALYRRWRAQTFSQIVGQEAVVETLRNVSLLERPVQPITLTSAVQSACRARSRQYEVQALLSAQERAAADLEAGTEKHPVTPGAIQPAREMLGELLLDLNQPALALAEFEASQRTDPNRFHGLAGAARSADRAGNKDKARAYYQQLLVLAKDADSERPELTQARAYLAK